MQIDIWSDSVCPWCSIGKRRFEAALARFTHRDDVTVRWHSYELDPYIPRNVSYCTINATTLVCPLLRPNITKL